MGRSRRILLLQLADRGVDGGTEGKVGLLDAVVLAPVLPLELLEGCLEGSLASCFRTASGEGGVEREHLLREYRRVALERGDQRVLRRLGCHAGAEGIVGSLGRCRHFNDGWLLGIGEPHGRLALHLDLAHNLRVPVGLLTSGTLDLVVEASLDVHATCDLERTRRDGELCALRLKAKPDFEQSGDICRRLSPPPRVGLTFRHRVAIGVDAVGGFVADLAQRDDRVHFRDRAGQTIEGRLLDGATRRRCLGVGRCLHGVLLATLGHPTRVNLGSGGSHGDSLRSLRRTFTDDVNINFSIKLL